MPNPVVVCAKNTVVARLKFRAILNCGSRRRADNSVQIGLSVLVGIDICTTVQRCPLRLVLEETHGLDVL